MEEGRVSLRIEELPLRQVFSLVEERNIDTIAVDNIFELASDLEGLARIFSRVAQRGVRLVEVTRIGDKNVKLEALCNLVGLCKGKLSPVETAEVVALLAYKGVGSEVLLFEEETRIHVGRGRVPGQGGMSRERYKRNIELLIKRKVAEIRDQLQKAGFDFDLFIRRSGVGLVGATFIVYAPREKLNGIVKQESGHDLFVYIQPVRRESIGYRHQGRKEQRSSYKERYLIVGIDPGVSTGVAVLDFNGNLVSIFSKRWLSRSQLLRILFELGRPAVVATDVNPAPSFVRKIAAQAGALLHVPSRSLSIEEKRRLVEGYSVDNTHERDALAAALKAYNEFKDKFVEVEKEAVKYNVPLQLDYSKYLVVKGLPIAHAVQQSIREYLHLSPKDEQMLHEVSQQGVEEMLRFYRRLVEKLANENRALQVELREANSRINNLETMLRNLLDIRSEFRRQSPEYSKLELKVEQLSRELGELRLQVEESKKVVSNLMAILKKVALGEYRIAFNLSFLLDAYQEKPSIFVEEGSEPLVFIDKSFPLDVVKNLLSKINELGSPPVIIVRRRNEIGTVKKIIPIGARIVPLDDIEEYFQLDDFLVVARSRLINALSTAESDETSKIRNLLDQYRKERMRSLEGQAHSIRKE
ncbi:MAG: DUF460 domain-containing protein [Infirmifilum sp.]